MKELEVLKDAFIAKIDWLCKKRETTVESYKFSETSPMWIQLVTSRKVYHEDRYEVEFRSSQFIEMLFYIPCTEEVVDCIYEDFNGCYNYFRDLKYAYIKENYPAIYKQIKKD